MRLCKIILFQFLLVATTLATSSLAQNRQSQNEPSRLNPIEWGVVLDDPATDRVTLKADVPYLKDAKGTQTLDIYLPPGQKAGEKRPAVIFLNAIGDRLPDKLKNWGIYKSWPRLVAAHGLVGISMEADGTRIQECLRAVFDFLAKQGADHGIDGSRLGVYAASANVTGSTEYLMSNDAARGIRAAALYYGNTPQGQIRADLPVLFIVAQSDAPRLRPQLATLWQRVVETELPWTLVFAHGLPHAFDAFSDNDDARRLIQQTIAFWKSHLEPVPTPRWKPSEAREIVATLYANDTQKAAGLLSKWVAAHPDDTEGYLQYGRVLQQLRRFEESSAAYERAYALDPNNMGVMLGLGQTRLGQKRWDEAAQLLSRAIDAGLRNSLTYGQLAFAQLHLGRNEEAIRNYEKAFEVGIPPGANTRGVAFYNMACGYAKLNQKDKALDALSKAVDEGFNDRSQIESDTDLTSLRSDPRFQQILGRLAARPAQQN